MILKITDLCKSFHSPGNHTPIHVLKGINLKIAQGETVAILGQSGSGKSTFLSLLAGLDRPTSGTIELDNQRMDTLSEENLSRFRARKISIVFQQFHLMPHLTALENVSLPLELAGDNEAEGKALHALSQVELGHRLTHFPSYLSGGECQRVAIARALVTRPALLLADEPTGSLDSRTGLQVIDQLLDVVQSAGMTMLLVTHDESLVDRSQRKLVLQEGTLHESVD
jgi:putative ABC transport system ATP-binding protein